MFCYLCSWCVYSLTLTLARAPLLLHPTLRTFPWDHLLPHLKYFPLNLLWLQVLLPALVCAEVSLLHSQNSGFSLSRPAQGGVAVCLPAPTAAASESALGLTLPFSLAFTIVSLPSVCLGTPRYLFGFIFQSVLICVGQHHHQSLGFFLWT